MLDRMRRSLCPRGSGDPSPDTVHFFFQAEDGIRDGHVTGVQTCALPILAASAPPVMTTSAAPDSMRRRALSIARSEERRVGKEGRTQWSPDLRNKNGM